jgi:hypothetical protein
MLRAYAAGDSTGKIAKDFGVSVAAVYTLLARPEAKEIVARILDDMDRELVQSAVYVPWLMLLEGADKVERGYQAPRRRPSAPYWPGERKRRR